MIANALRAAFLCIALLFLPFIGASGEEPAKPDTPTRFEVYSVGAADMNSTIEAVRMFVGEEGQVTPDPVHQRLLVVTTPERHAQISELMKKLAVPPRNVLIEVAIDSVDSQDAFETSVSGSGEITRGLDGFGGTIKLKPRIINQTTSRTGSEIQTLLVSSGREASLRVGESVPYLQWITEYGLHGGWNTPQLAWQEVGSFLIVQPTIVGEGPLVRVRLTPELRGLVDGQPQHTRFAAVSTEVVVRDGESISLGGLDQNREFYSRFLVGTARDGGTQKLNIRLTPRIQSPTPALSH